MFLCRFRWIIFLTKIVFNKNPVENTGHNLPALVVCISSVVGTVDKPEIGKRNKITCDHTLLKTHALLQNSLWDYLMNRQ